MTTTLKAMKWYGKWFKSITYGTLQRSFVIILRHLVLYHWTHLCRYFEHWYSSIFLFKLTINYQLICRLLNGVVSMRQHNEWYGNLIIMTWKWPQLISTKYSSNWWKWWLYKTSVTVVREQSIFKPGTFQIKVWTVTIIPTWPVYLINHQKERQAV